MISKHWFARAAALGLALALGATPAAAVSFSQIGTTAPGDDIKVEATLGDSALLYAELTLTLPSPLRAVSVTDIPGPGDTSISTVSTFDADPAIPTLLNSALNTAAFNGDAGRILFTLTQLFAPSNIVLLLFDAPRAGVFTIDYSGQVFDGSDPTGRDVSGKFSVQAGAVPIPVPATGLLLGTALLGAGAAARARRAR